MLEKGMTADYDSILSDIIRRDAQDSGRAYKPLTIAPDAKIIDTGDRTVDQVADEIIRSVRED